jgi:uncharacterized membrane protein YcaP (DUF421 family)
MTIPDLGSDLLGVAIRTAIVYLVLVVAFTWVGKRAAGQLSTLNLVVVLIVANAVQNAMVGQNSSLVAGLLAAGIILVLDLLLHRAAARFPWLRRRLDGDPTILVADGTIDERAMDRLDVSSKELAIALRQNGLLSVEEARFVFLEANGAISVIPYPPGAPRETPSTG